MISEFDASCGFLNTLQIPESTPFYLHDYHKLDRIFVEINVKAKKIVMSIRIYLLDYVFGNDYFRVLSNIFEEFKIILEDLRNNQKN